MILKRHKKAIILTTFLVALMAVIVSLVLLHGTQNATRISVVAAENTWGNIASQIGGNQIKVTSILNNPTADPHLHESNVQDASAVASANIVIVNGLGYDDFINKLIDASPNSKRVVISATDIAGLPGDSNPHIWFDPSRAALVANALEAKLASIDPTNAQIYKNNLSNFTVSMQTVFNRVDSVSQEAGGAAVAYTERLPEYLINLLKLTNLTPAGFASATEDGNEPSVADQEAFSALITKKQIKILFVNSQTVSASTTHLRDLANQNGIAVIDCSELLPPGDATYQDWIMSIINSIEAALAK